MGDAVSQTIQPKGFSFLTVDPLVLVPLAHVLHLLLIDLLDLLIQGRAAQGSAEGPFELAYAHIS
jgi:hypothetical protein